MDAKSFSTFLKETLINHSKQYEKQLLSTNYTTIEEAKRSGGIYDTLISVSSSIDKLLEDFYNQGGNKAIIETSQHD